MSPSLLKVLTCPPPSLKVLACPPPSLKVLTCPSLSDVSPSLSDARFPVRLRLCGGLKVLLRRLQDNAQKCRVCVPALQCIKLASANGKTPADLGQLFVTLVSSSFIIVSLGSLTYEFNSTLAMY